MTTQIDLGPNNPTGLHIHVPVGASASNVNNSSDFPNVSASVATPAKAVSTKIVGTPGVVVRFSSPA